MARIRQIGLLALLVPVMATGGSVEASARIDPARMVTGWTAGSLAAYYLSHHRPEWYAGTHTIVQVDVRADFHLEDGSYIGSEYSSWEGPADDDAYHQEKAWEWGLAAAASTFGSTVGRETGHAAGKLVMSMVPVSASAATYAGALGFASIAPYVGLFIGAGMAAY